MNIGETLHDLGFKAESANDEWSIYTHVGSNYGELIMVAVNVDSGEIEVTREPFDPEKDAPLVVRFSRFDYAIAPMLERWTK